MSCDLDANKGSLLCSEGMIATEDPTLRIREDLDFLLSVGEAVGDDDRDEESNHASGGADILLLRTLLSEFLRLVCVGGDGSNPLGTGSFTNSGRLSNAVGSSICIFSCTGSGMASRMNSGRVKSASGSLPLNRGAIPGGVRTASCE